MTKSLSIFALVIAGLSFIAPNMLAQERSLKNNLMENSTNTAATPAEHRAVAAYYRQRSEALRESSKEHLASAEARAKHPTFAALEVKHGFAFGLGASHCRYLANADEASANKAEDLARIHEDMARKAESSTNHPGSAEIPPSQEK